MFGEYVITQADWERNFYGEYDSLTHEPYHIGDVVVRCSNCRCVIKSAYVQGSCPVCRRTPFVSSPVMQSAVIRPSAAPPRIMQPRIAQHPAAAPTPQRRARSDGWYKFLILFSSLFTLAPLLFDGPCAFIQVCLFNMNFDVMCYVLLIPGVIAGLVLMCDNSAADFWAYDLYGPAILLIPPITPYAILLCVWIGIIIVGLFVLCFKYLIIIGLICCFIGALDHI